MISFVEYMIPDQLFQPEIISTIIAYAGKVTTGGGTNSVRVENKLKTTCQGQTFRQKGYSAPEQANAVLTNRYNKKAKN